MTVLTSLKQLHYLVDLSEQLNFTHAAEACFVTQSTLSAGVAISTSMAAQLLVADFRLISERRAVVGRERAFDAIEICRSA